MHDQINSSPIYQMTLPKPHTSTKGGIKSRVDDSRVEWGKEMRNQSIEKKELNIVNIISMR